MANEEKFTGIADTYAKYRPTYPAAFLSYLYQDIGFKSSSVIADIGSGTGIFSKLLLERDSEVYCVEPNRHMRSTAERYLSEFARFHSVDGTAENTALPDRAVDFITVAQAFHWFDIGSFKAECKRILKPGGKVVLVWNSRVKESPITKENAEVCKRFCPAFVGFSGGMEEKEERFAQFFCNSCYEHMTFQNDLHFDLNSFLGRGLSASYAPRKEEGTYQPYIDALTQLFHKYSKDGVLILPNVTRSYVGEV